MSSELIELSEAQLYRCKAVALKQLIEKYRKGIPDRYKEVEPIVALEQLEYGFRGELAVALSLGLPDPDFERRDNWAPYDLQVPNGPKLAVRTRKGYDKQLMAPVGQITTGEVYVLCIIGHEPGWVYIRGAIPMWKWEEERKLAPWIKKQDQWTCDNGALSPWADDYKPHLVGRIREAVQLDKARRSQPDAPANQP
jgi:hypothetical protein